MPTPKLDLFAFELHYANGAVDHGLITATSKETARLHLESLTLAGVEAIVVQGQQWAIETVEDQYAGVAFFTTESSCN